MLGTEENVPFLSVSLPFLNLVRPGSDSRLPPHPSPTVELPLQQDGWRLGQKRASSKLKCKLGVRVRDVERRQCISQKHLRAGEKPQELGAVWAQNPD